MNVDIYNSSGKLVGRFLNNEVDKDIADIPMYVDGDEKYIWLPDNSQYSLRFTAFDSGKMGYFIETIGTTETDNMMQKSFVDIPLINNKIMYSETGGKINVPQTRLYVLDKTGMLTKEIMEDGTETIINQNSNNNSGYSMIGIRNGGTVSSTQIPHSSKTVDVPISNPISTLWVNPFIDVNSWDWFYDSVRFANENKLMSGIATNLFSPNTAVTRAMLVTVLYRYEGEPMVSIDNPFVDIPENQWYADAVTWGVNQGIVVGYGNNKFGPDDTATREQTVTILYNYAKYKGIDISTQADLSEFEDAGQISQWALSAMKWAVEVGIISGKSATTIVPKGETMRAEIAAILHRFVLTQ